MLHFYPPIGKTKCPIRNATLTSVSEKHSRNLPTSAMLQPRFLLAGPPSLLLTQWLCPSCHSHLQRLYRHASTLPPPPEPKTPTRKPASDEEPTPKPLTRPLGQPNPPIPGENSGIDDRTWRERRADFFNYDKHLERRKQLYLTPSPPPQTPSLLPTLTHSLIETFALSSNIAPTDRIRDGGFLGRTRP